VEVDETDPLPAALVIDVGSTLLGVPEPGYAVVIRVSLAVLRQDGDVPAAQAD
jgi:hypothetical protein